MTLGIMQPYFFPYIGYFDLINRSDRWVVFDVVKYTPKSWMNRNRVLHPAEGWQYVTVPVDKHHEEGAIRDVRIVETDRAHARIIGQLEHYRAGRAPYFAQVRALVDRAFASAASGLLRDLNVATLSETCRYLGIPFDPLVLSQSRIELPEIDHPGKWALEISSAMGASAYVNPPGGRDLFDQHLFAERGIELRFTELLDYRYACGKYTFVERLSILDVLMWNDPAMVKSYLDGLRDES